jgi:hypothetical protein
MIVPCDAADEKAGEASRLKSAARIIGKSGFFGISKRHSRTFFLAFIGDRPT